MPHYHPPKQCFSALPGAHQGDSGLGGIGRHPWGILFITTHNLNQLLPRPRRRWLTPLCSPLCKSKLFRVSQRKSTATFPRNLMSPLHYSMCDIDLSITCTHGHYWVEMCSTWNQTNKDLGNPIWRGFLDLNSIHPSIHPSVHSVILPCFLCFFLYRNEQYFGFFQSDASLQKPDQMEKLVLFALSNLFLTGKSRTGRYAFMKTNVTKPVTSPLSLLAFQWYGNKGLNHLI